MKTQPTSTAPPIIIVGAGLGGGIMALYLARSNYQVDVYERRSQVELVYAEQRSFSVTLSKRGLFALKKVDLLDEVMRLVMPLRGRVVHDRDGSTRFVPYGNADHEQLYAIRRHDMNALLFRACQQYQPNIRFHFNQRLVRLDKQENTLWFQNELSPNNELFSVQSPLIIGSDGAFSVVRQQMQRGERADFRQEFLEWGYKGFFIPASSEGRHSMEPYALHLWPRKNFSVFAFPQRDGSYSANFLCPFAFAEEYQTSESLTRLLRTSCPDLLEAAPGVTQDLAVMPMSHLVTTYTSHWHYKDRIILIGDAAHAFTPFWGEGMNSAFEDARILDEMLASCALAEQQVPHPSLPLVATEDVPLPQRPIDRTTVFAQFQALRKPNTDIVSDLAKQNFIELRDTTGTIHTLAHKMLERWLYRFFPTYWQPLNIMISHSLLSYVEAWARYQRQQAWLRFSGAELVVWLITCWLFSEHALRKFARWLLTLPHQRGQQATVGKEQFWVEERECYRERLSDHDSRTTNQETRKSKTIMTLVSGKSENG